MSQQQDSRSEQGSVASHSSEGNEYEDQDNKMQKLRVAAVTNTHSSA